MKALSILLLLIFCGLIFGLIIGTLISGQSSTQSPSYSIEISPNNFLSLVGKTIMSYEEAKKEVVIKDENNVEVMRANLLTPLIYNVIDRGPGIKQLVAEIRFSNLDKTKSLEETFTKIYLYDKNNGMSEFNRHIEYRLRVQTGSYEYPVTDTTCSDVVEENGTAQKCVTNILKYNNVETYDYIPISSLNDLPNGEFVLGLFTDVQSRDNVEWIPSYFGEENKVEQWATWTDALNDGIKAFWKLNETSGTNALDSVDRSDKDGLYNGTSDGVVLGDKGLIGTSYGFDSSNDNINLSADMLNSSVKNFTISFWVNVTQERAGGANWFFYYTQSSTTNPEILARFETSTPRFWVWSSSFQCDFSPSAVNLNKWEHYVFQFTQDGTGNCTLWRNGTVLGNDGTVSFSSFTANTNRLGDNYQAGPAFNGTMDEVGWWDRYLTPSEIQDLYNNGSGITYSASGGGGGGCDYSGSGNWDVSTYCEQSNKGYNVSGNLTISSGGTLNLTNVTLNFNSTNQWIIFDNVADENKFILNQYSRINT